MSFLYNHWYVAALSNELAKPVGRKILGEDIVIYRGQSGSLAAMTSRCPHRFAPLEFGDVVGENIKCRYHGLQFGPGGACVSNPDGSAPPKVQIKTYPVSEKGGVVWIWMGDETPTDLPTVLDFAPTMGGLFYGYLHVDAHFQLLSDNLLDHSHATHLHGALKTEAAVKHSKGEVRQEGDKIYNSSWAPGSPPNPFFRTMLGNDDPVDQWVDMVWQLPATITIEGGVTPTGESREKGIRSALVHLVTPETETSSHYFWVGARDCRVDDHEYTETLRRTFLNIFTTEDKWILEAQQRRMQGQDFWDLKPVLLPQDKATGIARKYVDKILAEAVGAK